MKKQIISLLTVALMCAVTVLPSFAATSDFSFVTVDSNTYGRVTSKTKDSDNNYVSVMISEIYKSDGSSSTYNNVKVKFLCAATICTDGSTTYTATKGSELKKKLKDTYKGKNTVITLYAQGNNPKLDCQISGTLNVDTTK